MFENGQTIYIFNKDIEEWIYYTGYGDDKHMISDGIEVIDVTDKQLRQFHNSEDECVQELYKKYENIQKQCKEKLDFLNKEIDTLTKVVEDTKDNIKKHKFNIKKVENALGGLMQDFKPFIEKYPELFI